MLAAERALVVAHQRRRFLGDRAHLRRAVAPHVEDRPHVQRADRGVRVPGAARAVAREHLGQRVGVLGEVLERDGAVLDEAHRLAVALQAHHDVEAGLANLPEVLLRRVVGHLDDAARQAQVAHQLDQAAEARQQRLLGVARELDEQDRRRLAAQRRRHRRRERRVGERQVDHRPVDQLDRGRPERDDVLRRVHRRVEGREVDDAEHLRARQRRELERQRARPGERALGADQQVREVDAAVVGVGLLALRMEDVEVVAGDAAQHLRPARLDLAAVPEREVAHEGADRGGAAARVLHRPERDGGAIGEQRVDAEHVVDHVAVGDRARAARVVAGHAADRRLRAGRDVDREPEAERLQLRVEVVEDEARLDRRDAALGVDGDDVAQVLGGVDDQRRAGRLAALARAGAARQHRHGELARDLEGDRDVAVALRHEHADRHDLVDRGVGRVAAARGRVEQHVAFGLAAQAPVERDGDFVRRQPRPFRRRGASGEALGAVDQHRGFILGRFLHSPAPATLFG